MENNFFEILYTNEYFPYLRFKDIGAIVYFAKIIEWEFPNFSVESCFDKLCKLNEEINIISTDNEGNLIRHNGSPIKI